MDKNKKALTDLKKEHDDVLTALEMLYGECGEAQFEYAAHNADSIAYRNTNDFDTWRTLRESRLTTADTILNIKTAQSRQNELKTFYREADKLSEEQQHTYEKTRNIFASLFFQYYAGKGIACLQSTEEALAPLEEEVSKMEEAQTARTTEKMQANFFKKLTLSPQLMALSGKIRSLQKKIDEHIIAAAETIVADTAIERMNNQGDFSDELSKAYEAVMDSRAKHAETEERKRTLTAELEKQNDILQACGVIDTPQKRLTVLTAHLKQMDKEITAICRKQGKAYADMFYTESGVMQEGMSSSHEPELFKTYLDSIAEHRRIAEKKGAQIAYFENENALASEERKISAFHNAINNYKAGIAQYEQMIADAERHIAESEQIKVELNKRKNELLPVFSEPVDK